MTSPIAAIGASIPAMPSMPTLSSLTAGGAGAPQAITAQGATNGPTQATGADFGSILAQQVEQVQGLQSNADSLAQQAAAGTLSDPSTYMIASTEAALATDTVVTLKNAAVGAFNEIMKMPV